jgi:hypothetical protein
MRLSGLIASDAIEQLSRPWKRATVGGSGNISRIRHFWHNVKQEPEN